MKHFFFFITFLFISFPLYAGTFFVDADVVGQGRENASAQREIPVNWYLGLGLTKPEWHFGAETNMRLFRDFDRSLDDYDLYQTVLHFKPVDILKLDFGRQFVNEGFSANIIDGIRMTVSPVKMLDVAVYSGIPRSVETGDFTKNDGWLAGISVGLHQGASTREGLHARWRRNDIEVSNIRQNDEILVGADVSHQFGGKSSPVAYGLFEFNPPGKVVEAGTVGLDIYPARRLALNAEFNYFNTDRENTRQTILGLFAAGELLTGRFVTTLTLVPRLVDLVQSYAYQRIEIQEGIRRTGHLLNVGFPFSFEKLGLSFQPEYYYSRSFGGELHGVHGFVHEQFTERLYAEVGADYTTYTKITANNDNAFSVVAYGGYEILKGWVVSPGVEFNRNNAFDKDIRASLKIDYHYGHKI